MKTKDEGFYIKKFWLNFVFCITYFPKWISFVIVEASLHRHNRNAIQSSEHQLSVMSLNSTHGEIGNILVRYALRVSYSFS